jgi:hypothetical protein
MLAFILRDQVFQSRQHSTAERTEDSGVHDAFHLSNHDARHRDLCMKTAIWIIHWCPSDGLVVVLNVLRIADLTAADPELQAIPNQSPFSWWLHRRLSRVAHSQGRHGTYLCFLLIKKGKVVGAPDQKVEIPDFVFDVRTHIVGR